MPKEMDLRQKQTADGISDHIGSRLQPFAIHALACIKVHDELKEAGVNMSLPELCQLDATLSAQAVVVERYMLCAFGRNSTPVFRRILEKECNLTAEEFTPAVEAAAQALQSCISLPGER